MSPLYLLVLLAVSLPPNVSAPPGNTGRRLGRQPYCYETAGKDGSGYLQNVEPSEQATDPGDRTALEALYHTTAGPLWRNSAGWLEGDPCQSMWYGIKCSKVGRVLEINLFNNSLVGQLPPELGDLTTLQCLRIYNNMVGGEVPQELFTLTNLQVLDLDSNSIHGNLPGEFSSPELINLTIACNYFEGFLPSVWSTPKLAYLDIYNNLFSGPIPEGLGSAEQLLEIELSNNYFSSVLPNKMGNLKNLKKLRLSYNENTFTEIPDDWMGMESLQHLEMVGGAGGYFPYWMANSWRYLQVLDLSDGQLEGYDIFGNNNLCKMEMLNTLRLSYNKLEGDLPQCICTLSPLTLTNLQLDMNSFTGEIPDCLDKLTNLTVLDLSSNQLTGQLPLSVAGLKRLRSIDFSDNPGIYGEIPTQYKQLEGQLNLLALSRTHITSFGDGLGGLFKGLSSCSLYDIPFHCPLPTYLNGTKCFTQCSQCATNYNTCSGCVSSDKCGWCKDGHALCLEGTADRVNYTWDCSDTSWIYGPASKCPSKQQFLL